MKTKNLPTAALISLALLVATLCCSCSSSTPRSAEVHKSTTVFLEPGVPGSVTIQTYVSTAKVTAIDAEDRELSVVSPNGAESKFECGPRVTNFDKIKVGDQIRATVTQAVVVSVREPGAPETEAETNGAASTMALPVQGEKPGAVKARTKSVTATVQAIDPEKHEATLLFPDGSTKTYEVREDVDLTQAKPGQQVTIRYAESVAVLVEDP